VSHHIAYMDNERHEITCTICGVTCVYPEGCKISPKMSESLLVRERSRAIADCLGVVRLFTEEKLAYKKYNEKAPRWVLLQDTLDELTRRLKELEAKP